MKTPEQLKGAIRNIAREKGLHAQEVLQLYMFERLIERLSQSRFNETFVLKGGLLIAAFLGIDERTTMDMDVTVKGLPMREDTVRDAIQEILSQPVHDGVQFTMTAIAPIREDDTYENFRVSLRAQFGKMNIPMKIDITTGDAITPREIQFYYPLTFEEKHVPVMAYPEETVIAEKYETIIRRNIANTRARDFYDLHLLLKMYEDHAQWDVLKTAIQATSEKRGSSAIVLGDVSDIITAIEQDDHLRHLWKRYQHDNTYARGIDFDATVTTIKALATRLDTLS